MQTFIFSLFIVLSLFMSVTVKRGGITVRVEGKLSAREKRIVEEEVDTLLKMLIGFRGITDETR